MTDPTSLPNFPPPAGEHPLRGRVLDALTDAGLAPNIDEDGDIALEVNEQKLFVRCVDEPVPAMRVFGQWRIGEEIPDDELRQLRTASDVTLQSNLVKLGIVDGVLMVCVDHLAPEGFDINELVMVCIGGVLNAVQQWHVGAGGEIPPGAEFPQA